MLNQVLTPDLLFPAAFEVWMSQRRIDGGHRGQVRYIAPETERDYVTCGKALCKFFHLLRLDQIDEGHLAAYQQQRALNPVDTINGTWHIMRRGWCLGEAETLEAAQREALDRGGGCEFVKTVWAYPASASCIRKEVALLQRIMRSAGVWTEQQTQKFMKVQAVEPDVERAMSRDEQHRLLHVASGPERHRFIYQYMIIALQTTAGPNELRNLRLGDVFLGEREPYIEIPRAGAKNKYRKRTIPLITEDAVWAMEGLMRRARDKGAWSPTHYLFPLHIARGRYDPTRPMTQSGLKKPWAAVRSEAKMPRLRIYDLRHTGITRMAENGVPLPVAMSFAGHMTESMQQHYTAICLASQREWGAAVWGKSTRKTAAASIAPAESGVSGQIRAAFDGERKPVAAENRFAAMPLRKA